MKDRPFLDDDDQSDHWHQLEVGDDDGDNVITITLTDGGLGDDICPPMIDEDGEIVDQGGPGFPPAQARPVGGVLMPVNKLAIVTAYLALFGVIAAVIVAVELLRRLSQIQRSGSEILVSAEKFGEGDQVSSCRRSEYEI